MSLTKLVPVLATLTLAACGGSAPPAAAPAPAASASASPSDGATEAQGGAKVSSELDHELAVIDSNLADIARRLQTAQDAAKVELQQQLAILQDRRDQLRAQLRAAADQTEANASKVHREIQRAIRVLDDDMKQLEKQLAPGSEPTQR